MSTVYATEPATAGRVILETTDGPLEIALWSRECPDTTRLFLQLCMDGFYNDMVFHRIVNNFMIQTGALRHSSSKAAPVPLSSPESAAYRQAIGAPQALERRQYETNSRIRFNHRGQVAMALGANDKDDDDAEDLQPQFFVTLEDADYLNNKHVVFGTIGAGPTIFNALRIGRTETDDATHQPLDMDHATRIISVNIVDNPLHTDLVPQAKVPWAPVIATADGDDKAKKKKKKRKGKFDTNVLSFGSDFDEEDGGGGGMGTSLTKAEAAAAAAAVVKKKGMQSSHDVVESKVIRKEVDEQVKDVLQGNNNEDEDTTKNSTTDEAAAERKRRRLDLDQEENTTEKKSSHAFSSRKIRDEPSSNNQPVLEKPSKQKTEKSCDAPPKLSAVEARRLKYTKGKKSKKERENDTLSKLNAFRSTVRETVEERKSSRYGSNKQEKVDDSLAARMARRAQCSAHRGDDDDKDQAPAYNGQLLESDDDDNNNNSDDDNNKKGDESKRQKWLGTSFKCKRHMDQEAGKELGGDGRHADEYEVVDMKDGKHRRNQQQHRGGGGDKKHKHRHRHGDKSGGHNKHHHGRGRDHNRSSNNK